MVFNHIVIQRDIAWPVFVWHAFLCNASCLISCLLTCFEDRKVEGCNDTDISKVAGKSLSVQLCHLSFLYSSCSYPGRVDTGWLGADIWKRWFIIMRNFCCAGYEGIGTSWNKARHVPASKAHDSGPHRSLLVSINIYITQRSFSSLHYHGIENTCMRLPQVLGMGIL